jgi:WD repeat-containing protein 48
LIDQEIKRDEAYRLKLNEGVEMRQAAARLNPPTSISIPTSQGWQATDSPITPKANGNNLALTPGMGIGMASPAAHLAANFGDKAVSPSSPIGKRSSQFSRASGEDYFSGGITSPDAPSKPAVTPGATEQPATGKDEVPKSPIDEKGKDGKSSTPFSKKFRMGMAFGSKKLGRSMSSTATEKPNIPEEKPEENKSESSSSHEKEVDDSFRGVIQKIHNEYEKQIQEVPDEPVETKITPSLPNETPVLKLPSGTKVAIQEETSGGSADLYRGTVETVGVDADVIEEKAPMWLGELLLTVRGPQMYPSLALGVEQAADDRRIIPHPKNLSRYPLYCTHGRTRCQALRQPMATTGSMRTVCYGSRRSSPM